jgi:hypothetical protein
MLVRCATLAVRLVSACAGFALRWFKAAALVFGFTRAREYQIAPGFATC